MNRKSCRLSSNKEDHDAELRRLAHELDGYKEMAQLRAEEVRISKVSPHFSSLLSAHGWLQETCTHLESELELTKEKIEASTAEKLSWRERYDTQAVLWLANTAAERLGRCWPLRSCSKPRATFGSSCRR